MKVARAVPGLSASVLGVALFSWITNGEWISAGLGLGSVAILGFAARWIGNRCLGSVSPSHAVQRYKVGIVAHLMWLSAPIAFGAIVVTLLLVLALELPSWLSFTSDDDSRKQAADVLVGAVTAFLAFGFTDDLANGETEWWPDRLLQDLWAVTLKGRFIYADQPREYNAAMRSSAEDREGREIEGWGLRARLKRAEVVGEALSP